MTITGVLLAGGKSSRMGQNKAALLFQGEPLWRKQLDLLRRTQPAKILISAQSDPDWRPLDVEFVPDKQPSRGPLSGIVAALTLTTTTHLLVLAIDVPFMTEIYLRKLCQQGRAGQGVVPMSENKAEPLVAIYPREAQSQFLDALSDVDFSLQPVVHKLIAAGRLQSVNVSAEERALFRNLNEPADLPNGLGRGTRSA